MKTKFYTNLYAESFEKKKGKRRFPILLLSLGAAAFALNSHAQIQAMRSGNWTNPSTWRGGTVPSSADEVIIPGRYVVTVNNTAAYCNKLRLGSGNSSNHGSLTFSGTASLTVGDAIVFGDTPGAIGTLTMTPSATLIASRITEAIPDVSGVYNTDAGTVVFTGTFTLPNMLNNFNHLVISSGTTTTGTNSLNIDGDLSVSSGATLDLKSAGASRTTLGGTLQIANGGTLKTAGSFPSNFNTHAVGNSSQVEYNAASGTQSVAALNSSQSYGHLTISGSGIKRLTGNIRISGNLDILAGIFDTRTFSASRTSGGGLLTLSDGATLRIQGNGTLPANFTAYAISQNSTIEFKGGAQDVPALNSSQAYGNLTIGGTGNKLLAGSTSVNGNLAFESGAKLTVGNNTLRLKGTLINTSSEGITGGSGSRLIFEGAAYSPTISMDQTIPGTTNRLEDLTVNMSTQTLALENPLLLTGTLSVSSGTLFSNGNLTLVSSASATASVARGASNGGYITGDVTVERYISSGRKWHLLSVATDGGQTIKDAWQEGQASGSAVSSGYGTWITTNDPAALSLGFDYQSNSVSMKSYNPVSNNWTPTPSTLDPISTHQGYMIFIRGDRGCTSTNRNTSPTVLRSTGPLKQGDQAGISVAAGKNGAIGNPFASAIDFGQLNKSTAIDDYYYVWDPRLSGSQGLGAYQTFTFNGVGYTPTPGGGSYGIGETMTSNFIQSGQAFIVHATGSAGTVQVTESAKSSGSMLVSRPTRPAQLASVIRARLYADSVSGSSLLDGLLLEMDDIYSGQVDADDARKLANLGESIGISSQNELFSVERRSAFSAPDTVFLHLNGLKVKTYKLEISVKNLYSGQFTAVLQDGFSGLETVLSDEQVNVIGLTTTSDAASRASNRLRIVLRPAVTLSVKFIRVGAIRTNDGNMIDWEVAGNRTAIRYSVERSSNGQQFSEIGGLTNTGNNRYALTDLNTPSGTNYYRIRAFNLDGSVVLSPIAKVSASRSAAEITLVANPIQHNDMNIQLEGLSAGDYSVRVFNAAGQTLLNNRFGHPGGTVVRKISLPETTGPGVYFAEFLGSEGFRQTLRFSVE